MNPSRPSQPVPSAKSASTTWHAKTKGPFPASKPVGNNFPVSFKNSRDTPVKLEWIDRAGNPKSYGTIDSGKSKGIRSRRNAIWVISDESGNPLGYFSIGTQGGIAEVPPTSE